MKGLWVLSVVIGSVAIAVAPLVMARDSHTPNMQNESNQNRPIVIGHRGASGYVPEHTLTSYFIAIQQGADYIEPDLVSTKDGILVARHENEIGGTTDVAEHAEFAGRKTTKTVDGHSITGWFTEDFTLAELKTLRVRERLPQLRTANTRFDGQFEIPTFEEILALVQALNEARDKATDARHGSFNPNGSSRPSGYIGPIGVYVETKHPSYFAGLGLALEEPLLRALQRWGYRSRGAPVFIQSFEVNNLKQLRRKTPLPLIQLIEAAGAPYDQVKEGSAVTYRSMITPAGLAQVAQYANGIGVDKALIIPRNEDQTLGAPTTLVSDAHAQGLLVHAWTFRADNYFLPTEYRIGNVPGDLGNLQGELLKFFATGVDGVFTDHAVLGVDARDQFVLNR